MGSFFQLLLDEIQDKSFYPKIDTSMYRNQDSFNEFWIKNSIRKSSYWMHESESRLLILSGTGESGIRIFYNPRCLKGIRILQDWKHESKIDELPRLYDIYFAESRVAPYKYKLELYDYDIL